MEKVRPWCGQPSDPGRLKNRTEPYLMSLHYLVKCVVWNVYLNCDLLLHYKFIDKFARKRIGKIDEHLVKLQAKRCVNHSPYTFVLKHN